ncbi:flavin monoamine oxidase family protein [Tsukamurella pseudospumae]|uniref:Amine oxidase n=1 Tax=Tsukamurella pseudospumae TaxID=239498 RepID=A0A137ZQX9_9ACTN|nr:NAD(P)/FAD-dependent oxidoreductase [Tsukamurella pseudospumae]KXP00565.1 amine oxidase [Tsukamurella pseudospumae]
MTQPAMPAHGPSASEAPLTMFGPDFPFAYDDWVTHPDGLGSVPDEALGTEVAVIGAGLAGLTAAYELARIGLKPVVYEADRIGGRMRSERFSGYDDDLVAEMGAMRFPPSSTTLQHYLDLAGLRTQAFPNPLADATPSTVIDLKGESHYARTAADLPPEFAEVAKAWDATLADYADAAELQDAIRARDVPRIRAVWSRLVEELDDQTFYGFLTASKHFRSFAHRELFGQVGFGTGGWDTDYPNSMLEILRVTCTAADDHHRGIVGGSDRLPKHLWENTFDGARSVKDLNGGAHRPAVTEIRRTAGPGGAPRYTLVDAGGETRTFPAAIFTGQAWMLLNTIDCDDDLLPIDHWTAVERTHYMGSSKVFALVDRPFWLDVDPATGRDTMSMTLTDRMSRGTYLLDHGPDRPGVICLSYTWSDDSLKVLPLDVNARMDLMLKSLGEIYPGVDIRSHIIATPKTVSWETERYFMGAFKANLPGHYRYQERLYTHFMQERLDPRHRGFFLAGDDISWTAGWAEGALQTALNAVWGVVHHLGGGTRPTNPGPGDVFADIAPIRLGDERGTRA